MSLTENEFIISSSLELMIRRDLWEQDKGNSFLKNEYWIPKYVLIKRIVSLNVQ